ncbi:hypothetical protein JVT61DRAFT_15190 [Boletus reticuloceps]|uniref:Uncharacterized protein n=1 Tax=Boletus reticuloceps TaxID=495285 RepID=A0A8I2YQF2_9AGAM|nr:hypothetical protein JVT61DRAFT_15190 [Boletus reticuloceps]
MNAHSMTPCTPQDDVHSEVFLKTFSFFCVLLDKGCAFSSHADFPDSSDTVLQENNPVIVKSDDECDHRCKMVKCCGWLILLYDKYNQPYIKCSMHSQDTENAHLFLRNLQEFDMLYLEDHSAIYLYIETYMKSLGIGPLAPCAFVALCSEQKQVYSHPYAPASPHHQDSSFNYSVSPISPIVARLETCQCNSSLPLT